MGYKQPMDARFRGTLHKLYLSVFWVFAALGIIGIGLCVWATITTNAHHGTCRIQWEPTITIEVNPPITDVEDAAIAAELLKGTDCREVLIAVVIASWAPLLILVFTQKVLYGKWFLWLISDWSSSPDHPRRGE